MFWYKYLNADKLREGESIEISSAGYTRRGGMLRQKSICSNNQGQTKDTFGFKWQKRETYESLSVLDGHRAWLFEKYLSGKPEILEKWLPEGGRVLDAGCGSGFSSLLFFDEFFQKIHYLGVDISEAVDVAAERFKEKEKSAEFLQADILHLPFSTPVFDLIFSEGVLHHTDSTETAVKYLSRLLVPGGRFLFYVYRKKGPIREFSDDYIRNCLRDLDDSQTWEALLPLTKLGKALGDLQVKVNIPEDIPYLGIQAGAYDLQRLIYWHIFKAFYRPDWTLEEMNHVNFDWYRPLNCHRQSPEEVQQWCRSASLRIEHLDIQESGITVVAVKE